MNTESHDCHFIDAAHVKSGEEWTFGRESLKRPGDFFWLRNQRGEISDLVILIPGNEGGSIAPIPVARGPAVDGRWGWDGKEMVPTLVPSIWRNRGILGGRNEWHGHLTAGRLVSC